ncbi:hypothetical protein JKA74_15435 [Marivirga sp. S37H4]|uniref:Lipoprotein n=1 Tax=Marivirga aurantiaca TaxID=2802615 RepID=A0A934X0X9_9BACT|nr:hypothetical protein [Marivirga aurantiaca]MBK6266437.1 hypothetical protein [Marivirga aurantiaca]
MRLFLVCVIAFMMVSCQKDTEAFLPTEKFNSIFDNPTEGQNYEPIDVAQTEDGGYLILASTNSNQVFVMKVSPRGEFIWSKTMSSAYISPVGNIVKNQGNYYFIVSTLTDRTAVLVEVKDFDQIVEPLRNYTGYRRPLAFGYLNPDNYLLLTHNDTIGAVLSKIQEGFAMEWARGYDEFEEANSTLDDYLDSNTPEFFVGAYNNGSNIYFNTLRPDGMTMTYANDQGIETGRISATDGDGINSIITSNDGKGSFNYTLGNQSFFANGTNLANNDSTYISQLDGELQPDRLSNKKALSLSIELSATPYIVNAFTTVDGRIKLAFYSDNSRELSAIEYVGGNDPMEVVKIMATEDQGLVVLAKIIMGGVKQRISLFKIPKEEIVDLF